MADASDNPEDLKGEEGSFEASAFEALERDFQQVLNELVGDKSLERFRQEYEKLHKALKKSHESEKRLIKKCRELNAEIVSNASKVQTALKRHGDYRQPLRRRRQFQPRQSFCIAALGVADKENGADTEDISTVEGRGCWKNGEWKPL